MPTFHITHWKAGSQWVQHVFMGACPQRVVVPTPEMQLGVIDAPPHPGAIYTPMYLAKSRFEQSAASRAPHRKFIVIRDLRDTLVSWYFSLRHTHNPNPTVADHRTVLAEKPTEEGLLYLLAHRDFNGLVNVAASWRDTSELLIRYEQLVAEPHVWFGRIFDYCCPEVPPAARAKAINQGLFESLARRPRGQELRTSHLRKGIAGDWRNHFTPRIVQEFKGRFGEVLTGLGYGTEGDW